MKNTQNGASQQDRHRSLTMPTPPKRLRRLESLERRRLRRRDFAGGAAAAALAVSGATSAVKPANPSAKFKLKYAPGVGMFRHHAGDGPIDQMFQPANVL